MAPNSSVQVDTVSLLHLEATCSEENTVAPDTDALCALSTMRRKASGDYFLCALSEHCGLRA